MAMKINEGENADENDKEISNLKSETKISCKPKRILQAISVLRQLNDKYKETCEKKPLLDDISDNPVFIQIALKKIPALKWKKCVKVPLPHPIVKEKTEVCLITGDLDKRNRKADVEADVLHYKELLKSQNITQISEVITLRQLRTEYKSFESRRNLYGAYDIFLCDKKIAGVMPKVLGKYFYGKRKIPIQINMAVKSLKDTIENVLKNTVFHLSCKGNCCVLEVASLSMTDEEIVNNVSSSIKYLKDKFPGGVENIMSVYVKTTKSKALPIYVSFDNPNDIKIKKRKFKKENVEEEEITTLLDAKVKVFKSGRVLVRKIKDKKKPFHKSKKPKSNSDKKIIKISQISNDDSVEGKKDSELISETVQISKKVKRVHNKNM